MKTKHLLAGLVMPALFAACTAEEIVSQQDVVKVDLGDRPVVGNVELDFGGMESRGTIGDRAFNDIAFVKGEDGFGARIIDAYAPVAGYATYGDHPYRNYQVTDAYASSNYKYVNNGGSAWVTDALMVEGNYLFYYPYNEANLARTPNVVKLPVKQTVSKNIPNQPIKDLYEGENPAIVGYAFLKAEGQEATVAPELNHIFAYPQFTLVNNYTVAGEDGKAVPQELTITKIQVSYASENVNANIKKFYKDGKINHTGFVNAFRNFSLDEVKDGSTKIYDKVDKGTWAAGKSSLLKNAKTADIVEWNEASSNIAEYIEVTFDGGLTLKPGDDFAFNLVLPAATYAWEDLKFTVYLANDKMLTWVETVDQNIYKVLTYAPSLRFPNEEYNNLDSDNASTKPSAGTLGTITIENNEDFENKIIDAVEPASIIDNATEFEAFLNTLADNSATVVEVEKITDVKKAHQFALSRDANGVANMKIDANIVALIKKYLSKGGVEFNHSIMEIVGGEDAVVLNQIEFNDVCIKSGNVTIQNLKANDAEVCGDAVVTIPANATVDMNTLTVKAGEVIVEKEELFIDRATGLSVVVTNTKNNSGQEIAAGKLTIKADGNNFKGLTMNAGKVIVAEDVTAHVGQSANDYVTTGTIVVDGELEVWSGYKVAEDVEVELNGTVDLNSHTGAKIINEGLIKNNSSLVAENQFGGKIEMGDVTSYLKVSGNEGIVDNTKLAEVDVEGGAVQTVYAEMANYAAAQNSNFEESSSINKVIITGLWTVDGSYLATGWSKVETVEFNGGGLYVNAGQTFDLGSRNIIIAADTEWRGRSTGTIKSDEAKEFYTYKYLASKNRNAKLTISTVAFKQNVTTATTTVDGLSVTLSTAAISSLTKQTIGGKEVVKTMEIHTAQDMMSFLDLYKEGKVKAAEGKEATISLAANIDMSGKAWEPLNLMHTTFEGNDKVISNLKVEGKWAGFFGYSGASKIQNLTIRNVQVTGAQAGAFTARAEGTTISNCKLEGTVIVNWKKYDAESYNGVGAAAGVISGGSCNIGVDASNAKITINKEGITYPAGKSGETTTNLVGVVYDGSYSF